MSIYIYIKQKPGKGHLVSKSERKTNRKFKINKQILNFYSKSLKTNIKVISSSKYLRLIQLYGSIDYYLNTQKVIKPFKKLQKYFYSKNNNYHNLKKQETK